MEIFSSRVKHNHLTVLGDHVMNFENSWLYLFIDRNLKLFIAAELHLDVIIEILGSYKVELMP